MGAHGTSSYAHFQATPTAQQAPRLYEPLPSPHTLPSTSMNHQATDMSGIWTQVGRSVSARRMWHRWFGFSALRQHPALLALAALLFFVSGAMAQTVMPGYVPPRTSVKRVMLSTPAAAPTSNLTGFWHGGLNAPGSSNGAAWVEEIELHQDGNGSVTGTRRTVPQQKTAGWVLWSITGSISGSTLTFPRPEHPGSRRPFDAPLSYYRNGQCFGGCDKF